jgi:formylglycine-generating enzyme required for sulfatase activity
LTRIIGVNKLKFLTMKKLCYNYNISWCRLMGLIILFCISNQIKVVCAAPPAGMVLIPAGEFIMGSEEGEADESPVQKIYLEAFYLDKYEVTNYEYRQFVTKTHHREPYDWENTDFNQDKQPVVGVSWNDATDYCGWAKKRLPTEAEWEKAARGEDGRTFPWGNKWDERNANSSSSNKQKTVPVGSYPKGISPYGAYDMAGNVWEWCNDWYSENYYHMVPKQNPAGPSMGDAKAIRGGGWFDSPAQLRSSNRYYSHAMVRYNAIGFRCAKDLKSSLGKNPTPKDKAFPAQEKLKGI